MGLLDSELSADEKKSVEMHLDGCVECRGELEEFNNMKGVMKNMRYKEPPDEVWEKYWSKVYNRLERGLSWILVSIGAIILLFYGGFKAVESLVRDPTVAIFLKVAILVLLAGLVILFVSVLRERIFTYKKDKYAKEVKR
jgi:predicted anti-sigma-YlaC factor YlaD